MIRQFQKLLSSLFRKEPMNEKRSCLIAAVAENDVEALKELLDSPKWYNVKDEDGYTLLHIAISQENIEVFDYMLCLKDFPINAVNKQKETPLEFALTSCDYSNTILGEYFACELLKKDARIDFISYDDNTPLHCALIAQYVRVAKLLLDKGANVNALNRYKATPLDYFLSCCKDDDDLVEGVTMLLCSGADPFILNEDGDVALDCVLQKCGNNVGLAQEMLFYYTIDEYSYQTRTISIYSLLWAAQIKCPFFYQLLDKISKVNYCNDYNYLEAAFLTCTIELHYLKALTEKFSYAFEDMFLNVIYLSPFHYVDFNEQSLQNIDLLINSKCGSAVIETICKTELWKPSFHAALNCNGDVSLMSEIVCYFLSYGMSIKAEDLHFVYEEFGFCELFKILLHMDVKEYSSENARIEANIIPALFYDVKIYNIETYLQDRSKFPTYSGVEDLLFYSAHPKLKEFCYTLEEDGSREGLIEKVKLLPHIPLLVELARDVFREYFIKKFDITTSKQFYTMLKMLPVSEIHRKIITFETKLYEL